MIGPGESSSLSSEGGIDALVEVSDALTSQSRDSLRLSGSPPHGKLLIPLERRDVRVVEGARLENDSGDAHGVILKHLFAQSIQRLPTYAVMFFGTLLIAHLK